MVLKPRSVRINGNKIYAGNFLHMISEAINPVSMTTWSSRQTQGEIHIGHYALISPGVELSAAHKITIGDNCMIAADSIISDSDWHGIYNRLRPFRCTQSVELKNNVWIGRGAFVGKGVCIGENSIVGARAVVCKNVPANCIVAGNPARIIKHLNPKKRMLKREYLFQKGDVYWGQQQELLRYLAADNSLTYWLKTLTAPNTFD